MSKLGFLTVVATFVLGGCDSLSVRGEGENGINLEALRTSGINNDDQTRTETRLQAVLDRDNSIGELSEGYAEFDANPNATYALEALATLALERNPEIRRAVEQLNLSEVERLNAIFGYLPQVSLSFSQDTVDQTVVETDNVVFELGQANFPVTTFAVSLRQPIFDLSKIFDIQYAAAAQTKAEVNYIVAVRSVSYDIFDTALAAEQSRNRITSLQRRQNLLGRQISRNDVLRREGLTLDAQSAALRADRATLLSDIANEQGTLGRALADLSRMTGTLVQNVAPFRAGSGVLGTERSLTVEQAVELGMVNNPEVMTSALAVVESELLRRGALARDFSPVIEAYAILEEEDRGNSRFGGGSVTEDLTVGVAVTVPLFNAGGQGYETLTRNVQERAATLDYYGTRRELESEIRSTHTRMGLLSTAISQARSAVSNASSAAVTERRRVNAGESIDIALAAREIRLEAARERLAFQELEYYRAWAEFKFLTGADLAAGTL